MTYSSPYVTYSFTKVTYSHPRVTYSYPKVTNSGPKVTSSGPKVTYSGPKVTNSDRTHLPLPPLASPDLDQAISKVKINFWVGGGGRWQTNFNVSSRLGFKL